MIASFFEACPDQDTIVVHEHTIQAFSGANANQSNLWGTGKLHQSETGGEINASFQSLASALNIIIALALLYLSRVLVEAVFTNQTLP